MLDCKPLATPMVPHPKLHADLDSNLIDPSIYRKMIGSLIYLVNTKYKLCFAMNTLSHFMVEPSKFIGLLQSMCSYTLRV